MMALMESLFDIGYLGLIIFLGLRLLLEEGFAVKRYAIMVLLLGIGDAFHLIPRIISHLSPDGFVKNVAMLSWGQFVTSITMTIFYVLFYHYYIYITKEEDKKTKLAIYTLAAIRIAIILLPQNAWGTEGSYIFGIIRNIPFTIMGCILIYLCYKHRKLDGLKNAAYYIAASFVFYLIVVLGADFIPALGAFMLPKTVAYVLLVFVGYRYFTNKSAISHSP